MTESHHKLYAAQVTSLTSLMSNTLASLCAMELVCPYLTFDSTVCISLTYYNVYPPHPLLSLTPFGVHPLFQPPPSPPVCHLVAILLLLHSPSFLISHLYSTLYHSISSFPSFNLSPPPRFSSLLSSLHPLSLFSLQFTVPFPLPLPSTHCPPSPLPLLPLSLFSLQRTVPPPIFPPSFCLQLTIPPPLFCPSPFLPSSSRCPSSPLPHPQSLLPPVSSPLLQYGVVQYGLVTINSPGIAYRQACTYYPITCNPLRLAQWLKDLR